MEEPNEFRRTGQFTTQISLVHKSFNSASGFYFFNAVISKNRIIKYLQNQKIREPYHKIALLVRFPKMAPLKHFLMRFSKTVPKNHMETAPKIIRTKKH